MTVYEPLPAPPPPPTQPPTGPPDTSQNWLGIVALVSGLCALALPALVFGILGLRAASSRRATNRGLSWAGVILGSLDFLIFGGVAVALIVTAWTQARADHAADPVADLPSNSAAAIAGATTFELVPDATSDPALLGPAAAFLRTRVDAEVTLGEGVIVVDFGDTPPSDGVIELLPSSSSVQMRPVVTENAPTPWSSGYEWEPSNPVVIPSWAGDPTYFLTDRLGFLFDSTDCTVPDQRAATDTDPNEGIVSCSPTGDAKFLLGSVVLLGTDALETVQVGTVAAGDAKSHVVQMIFDDDGAAAFADLTGQLAEQESPNNQVAMVADGMVWSYPSATASITDGHVEISGADFEDIENARALAGALTYGSPLMRLSIQSAHN